MEFFESVKDFFTNLYNFDAIYFFLLVGFMLATLLLVIACIVLAVKNSTKEKAIKEYMKIIPNLQSSVSFLEGEKERLSKESETLQEDLNMAIKKKNELIEENERLKDENENLRKTTQFLNSKVEDKDALLKQSFSANENLREENKTLQEELDAVNNKADRVSTAKEFFKMKFEHLKAENKALRNVIVMFFNSNKERIKNTAAKVADKSKEIASTAKTKVVDFGKKFNVKKTHEEEIANIDDTVTTILNEQESTPDQNNCREE